jgi:hypothetical protein
VRGELRLRPGLSVGTILLREEDPPGERARLEKERAEAWRKLDEVRQQLSGMPFSATDAVTRARRSL